MAVSLILFGHIFGEWHYCEGTGSTLPSRISAAAASASIMLAVLLGSRARASLSLGWDVQNNIDQKEALLWRRPKAFRRTFEDICNEYSKFGANAFVICVSSAKFVLAIFVAVAPGH